MPGLLSENTAHSGMYPGLVISFPVQLTDWCYFSIRIFPMRHILSCTIKSEDKYN